MASTKKGSKPDFHGALGGEQAKELYQVFFSKVQQGYKAERVKDGVFQAMMVRQTAPSRQPAIPTKILQEVALVNDGPVSLCSLSRSDSVIDK